MCGFRASFRRGTEWVAPEVEHKGKWTKIKQMIQEEQGVVECYA